MPRPKLDAKSDTVRMHLAVPSKLLQQVEAWRGKQRPIPNASEAIRRLVEQGLSIESELKKRERKR